MGHRPVKCYDYHYTYFGKLKSVDHNDHYLWITNEEGEQRFKKKIYQSWRTTLDKCEDMIDQEVITRTTYDTMAQCNEWFSDVYVDEKYMLRFYDEKLERKSFKTVSMLWYPKLKDHVGVEAQQSIADTVIKPRIEKQDAVYWAKRRAKWEYSDIAETNALLQEEQEALTRKELSALDKQSKMVREAAERWVEQDKSPRFAILGDRHENAGMTHVDVDFARRCRIDTTSYSRIEAEVIDYLDKNYIKVKLNLKTMDKPMEVGLALWWLAHENRWQIRSVRPLHVKHTSVYRVERDRIPDKDAKTDLSECFDFYDYMIKHIG